MKTKSVSSRDIGPLEDPLGNIKEEDKDISEILNNFFSSVFTVEDVSNIPDPVSISLPNQGTGMNYDININEGVVRKALREVKNNKSDGIDGITSNLILAISESLVIPITAILIGKF